MLDLERLRRPHPRLLVALAARSLKWGPLFPIPLLLGLVRYRTLRYRFDEEGISVSWGALYRREVSLGYRRIQDLHVVSGPVERWLGLARILVQTASGSAKAEMTIEGFLEHRELRDALYARMVEIREERHDSEGPASAAALQRPTAEGSLADSEDEVVAALEATRQELAAVRAALEALARTRE